MATVKDIAKDIKDILEFYQAFDFERLPIKIGLKNRRAEGQGYSGAAAVHPVVQINHHKIADLKSLREEIGDCHRCKLSRGRTNLVFGEGNPDSKIMFIGEAPGREEDMQGRPFVGDAGQLLTRLIERMGFKREEVYIANIIKCRPPLNRDPEEDEAASCLSFVTRQVEIISPEVILLLGRVAAQALIRTKVPISRLRGNFYEYRGIPVMPTFHPAYLLRNPKDKWLTWNDAQKVLERIQKA